MISNMVSQFHTLTLNIISELTEFRHRHNQAFKERDFFYESHMYVCKNVDLQYIKINESITKHCIYTECFSVLHFS